MADILSATSLLLTIITVLYGLWYGEINEAINIKVSKHKEDNKCALDQVESILKFKANPLFIACLILVGTMIAEVVPIVRDGIRIIIKYRLQCFQYYDSVRMIYCIVCLFTFAILLYVSIAVYKLWNNKKKLLA